MPCFRTCVEARLQQHPPDDRARHSRRRRRMTAAQRKAMGERMKKYWAAGKAAGVTKEAITATAPMAARQGCLRPARTWTQVDA